jgi:hypothetical protein
MYETTVLPLYGVNPLAGRQTRRLRKSRVGDGRCCRNRASRQRAGKNTRSGCYFRLGAATMRLGFIWIILFGVLTFESTRANAFMDN